MSTQIAVSALSIHEICRTACRDFKVVTHNAGVRQDRTEAKAAGANPRAVSGTLATGFLPTHCSRAKRPSDIVWRALQDIETGRRSKKVAVRHLYADAGKLQDALILLREYGE